jgi:hypothetical protein
VELFEDIAQDVVNIFSKNKKNFDKSECKCILNIIFESIFDEKLKNKNFNYIYNLINKTNKQYVTRTELEPVIKALIVSFDVIYITNSNSFDYKFNNNIRLISSYMAKDLLKKLLSLKK